MKILVTFDMLGFAGSKPIGTECSGLKEDIRVALGNRLPVEGGVG